MAKKPLNKKSPKAGKKPVKKKLPRKKMPNGLTIKQEKFCHVYMETGNASEAYRQVYSCGKMKPETIRVKACLLLKKDNIRIILQGLKEELKEVSNIKKERLLYEMEAIINAKITDYIEFNGKRVRFKSFDDLTDQQVRAIESIKQNDKGEIELKLHGKSWSTDRIAKLLGLDAPKKTDITSGGKKINPKIVVLPSNSRENDDHN